MSNNTEYKNVVIAGVWATKNGHFNTMAIDAKAFDKISQYAEIGGKFLIRKRSEASISKSKDPERSPPYYLEFVPASEVKSYEERNPRKHSPQGL